MENIFIVKDWADNVRLNGKEFGSFEEAEEFLSEWLGDDYDTDRQEYYIELKGGE